MIGSLIYYIAIAQAIISEHYKSILICLIVMSYSLYLTANIYSYWNEDTKLKDIAITSIEGKVILSHDTLYIGKPIPNNKYSIDISKPIPNNKYSIYDKNHILKYEVSFQAPLDKRDTQLLEGTWKKATSTKVRRISTENSPKWFSILENLKENE